MADDAAKGESTRTFQIHDRRAFHDRLAEIAREETHGVVDRVARRMRDEFPKLRHYECLGARVAHDNPILARPQPEGAQLPVLDVRMRRADLVLGLISFEYDLEKEVKP